jgi:hypothetical protein
MAVDALMIQADDDALFEVSSDECFESRNVLNGVVTLVALSNFTTLPGGRVQARCSSGVSESASWRAERHKLSTPASFEGLVQRLMEHQESLSARPHGAA